MVKWDLDDAVLESYIQRFYGHGRYEARYWFIGMEFGGGNSAMEIVRTIQGWFDRGAPELEDLVSPQRPAQGSHWFEGRVPLQPT